MPPVIHLDPSTLDVSKLITTHEEIYAVLPQRHEFALLDGLLHFDRDTKLIAAIKHIHSEDWWTRGHLPERALFPGVLMIEAAAQLASYYGYDMWDLDKTDRFLGFAGLEKVKFRDAVEPPCDLIIIGHLVEHRSRKFVVSAQEFVNNKMVFQGVITGMAV